jgi:protein-S-isoprenylcysteine O-methyltransferase Ste14
MFRWWTLVLLVAVIGSSGYYRRRAHKISGQIARSSEGTPMMVARALVALPLFLAPVVYVVNPRWMEWASLPLPTWLRVVGFAVAAATVPAVHWILGTLGANVSETVLTKEHHQLVTDGPYAWVRHPLYTNGLALFFGLALMQASWFGLVTTSAALAGIAMGVIPREERELEGRFGEQFRAYKARTGRLAPRFRRTVRA